MKKAAAFLLCLAILFAGSAPAFAEGTKTIIFKGEAEKFVTNISGDVQQLGFTNMQPGDERSLTLTLRNDDAQKMTFYMSAEILDNIAEKTADGQAVYDFVISRNGEVFFSTVIGGGQAYNQTVGDQYLDASNNILLDTLGKGESNTVTITLKLDGDSAGNSYMNQTGQIQLVFTVATPTPNEPVTVINNITKYITGQGTTVTQNSPYTGLSSPWLWISVVLIAAAVIVLVVINKRKRKDGDHRG